MSGTWHNALAQEPEEEEERREARLPDCLYVQSTPVHVLAYAAIRVQ